MLIKIKYSVNDSEVKNHFGEVPDRNCYEDIAEECAKHYHEHWGFSEEENPMVIHIFADENYIGGFEIFGMPAVYMAVKA